MSNKPKTSQDITTIYSIANIVNELLYRYINTLPKDTQDEVIRSVLVEVISMYNNSSYSEKINIR